MHKINLLTICSFIVVMMACKKETTLATLPDGSISFDQSANVDVIEMPVSNLDDVTITVEMKATLAGTPPAEDHYVSFAADTTKIADYRAKYGAATLLPTSTYLFFKSLTVLPAGETKTEPAKLNIGQQSKLAELTTYVLPVVVKSVDGKSAGTATNRVLYYVFKTGPGFMSRTGWTATASSVNGTAGAANVVDANNVTTIWTSNITQAMPQWVSINFNKELTFTKVTYFIPATLAYPKNGGYPTSIQIETSMNGTTWVNKGTFVGNIVRDKQFIDLGAPTTARYLRFTSLASVKLISGANQYDAIQLSGIALVP